MLRVSRAEGDPRLIARFKVFGKSLTVNGFIKFLIQGLQGSKGQMVQHMKGYIHSLSPGHKGGQGSIFPKLTGFQGLNISRVPKDPRDSKS